MTNNFMKNKKKILVLYIIIFALSITFNLSANPVNIDMIKKVAVNYMKFIQNKTNCIIGQVIEEKFSNKTALYIITFGIIG